MTELLSVMLLGISGGIWAWMGLRRLRGKRTLPRALTPPVAGLFDVAMMIVVMTVVSSIAVHLLRVFGAEVTPLVASWGSLAGIGISAALVIGRSGVTLSHATGGLFDRNRLVSDLLLGVGTFFAVAPPVLLLHAILSSVITYEHREIDRVREAVSTTELIATAFNTVIVAPLAEEWLYRGLLLAAISQVTVWRRPWEMMLVGSWQQSDGSVPRGRNPDALKPDASRRDDVGSAASDPKRDGSGRTLPTGDSTAARPGAVVTAPPRGGEALAIGVSSLVFALMHVGQGAAPVSLFFFAVGLALVTLRTGRIRPAVVAHMLLNGMTILNVVLGRWASEAA